MERSTRFPVTTLFQLATDNGLDRHSSKDCHLLGGGFRETDASMDSMARRSRKTWLYGDPVEADGTQSLYGSGGRRPKFIQVATYLQKAIPRRQAYICRLMKGARPLKWI
jgi:hypothetical protein